MFFRNILRRWNNFINQHLIRHLREGTIEYENGPGTWRAISTLSGIGDLFVRTQKRELAEFCWRPILSNSHRYETKTNRYTYQY